MSLEDIKQKCKKGYTGLIPGWVGYLDWSYQNNSLYFHNGDYILEEKELEKLLNNRKDIYYII